MKRVPLRIEPFSTYIVTVLRHGPERPIRSTGACTERFACSPLQILNRSPSLSSHGRISPQNFHQPACNFVPAKRIRTSVIFPAPKYV